jgi:hypothetical protein
VRGWAARRLEKAKRDVRERIQWRQRLCDIVTVGETEQRQKKVGNFGHWAVFSAERRDKVLEDLGFGPFSIVMAFLFSEVHLSPVFFFFCLNIYVCISHRLENA